MRVFTKRTADLRDRARDVAEEFREAAGRIDEEDAIPPELVERLWESGAMSLRVPRRFGGGEASLPEVVIVVEELARGCGAAGLMVMLQALALSALREFGTPRQLEEWLPRIVDGRWSLAFALSEPFPEPGEKSRVTFAKKLKAGYYLRGKKTYVSGAREADLVIVFAVTSPRAGLRRALSAFVIPAGTPGLLPGRILLKSGLRGVPAVELWLEGCEVKAQDRLGKIGQGYQIARRAMISAAPLAGAISSGLLAEAVAYLLHRTRKNRGTGDTLSEFQPLELAVAELSVQLDISLLLTWVAAGALEEGRQDAERLAREAKWLATEAAVNGLDSICRLFGMEAAPRGSLLERLSRDVHAAQFLLGPNHLHRIEVARKLLWGGGKTT